MKPRKQSVDVIIELLEHKGEDVLVYVAVLILERVSARDWDLHHFVLHLNSAEVRREKVFLPNPFLLDTGDLRL